MGFRYFGGARWAEVTRDERFFCQRLYELVNSEPIENFIRFISEHLNLNLPINGEWEIGYEVCFYRDLWQHRGRKGKLYSPKRTFDLCLFGEQSIVIIEAKAAGGFDCDQNKVFKKDIAEVQSLTKINNIQLVGLCSSKYEMDESAILTFGNRVIRWNELSKYFDNDQILKRADDIYEKIEAFAHRGRYSDIKLSGAALLEAYQVGAEWWVGRGGGGINGERFIEDVRTGRWKSQIYEVSTKANEPPSANYFAIADFVEAIEQGK